MPSRSFVAALATLVLVLTGATSAARPTSSAGTLTFSDEFNGRKVDWSRWVSGTPWGTRTNLPSGELQAYTPSNVTISGGALRLTARREPAVGDDSSTMMEFSSGMIHTAGKFAQLYGRFEARLRVPAGRGLWPAFWLLPATPDWPTEIDVVEVIGQETRTAYLTNHFYDPAFADNHGYEQRILSGLTDYSAGYNTFAIEWTPGKVDWIVNGTTQFTSYHSPTATMFPILNLAVGGNWPGAPDASTAFPSSFDVDYIRIYGPPAASQADVTIVPEPVLPCAGIAVVLHVLMGRRRPTER